MREWIEVALALGFSYVTGSVMSSTTASEDTGIIIMFVTFFGFLIMSKLSRRP
jgi:hypothetical protein